VAAGLEREREDKKERKDGRGGRNGLAEAPYCVPRALARVAPFGPP
jgi:hypothetical protein